MDLEETLRYPLEGEDALVRIAIGGVLGIFSLFILPALVVYGYYVEEVRSLLRGEEEPPGFDDWGGMLVDGVKVAGIGVVYAVIPVGLVSLLFGGAALAGMAGGGPGFGALAALFGIGGMLVVMLVLLAVYYILPGVVVHFAAEGELGAAFDFDAVRPLLLHGDYLTTWLVALAVGVGASLVSMVLQITVVGILLLPFLGFYVGMVVFRLFAETYRELEL